MLKDDGTLTVCKLLTRRCRVVALARSPINSSPSPLSLPHPDAARRQDRQEDRRRQIARCGQSRTLRRPRRDIVVSQYTELRVVSPHTLCSFGVLGLLSIERSGRDAVRALSSACTQFLALQTTLDYAFSLVFLPLCHEFCFFRNSQRFKVRTFTGQVHLSVSSQLCYFISFYISDRYGDSDFLCMVFATQCFSRIIGVCLSSLWKAVFFAFHTRTLIFTDLSSNT